MHHGTERREKDKVLHGCHAGKRGMMEVMSQRMLEDGKMDRGMMYES